MVLIKRAMLNASPIIHSIAKERKFMIIKQLLPGQLISPGEPGHLVGSV